MEPTHPSAARPLPEGGEQPPVHDEGVIVRLVDLQKERGKSIEDLKAWIRAQPTRRALLHAEVLDLSSEGSPYSEEERHQLIALAVLKVYRDIRANREASDGGAEILVDAICYYKSFSRQESGMMQEVASRLEEYHNLVKQQRKSAKLRRKVEKKRASARQDATPGKSIPVPASPPGKEPTPRLVRSPEKLDAILRKTVDREREKAEEKADIWRDELERQSEAKKAEEMRAKQEDGRKLADAILHVAEMRKVSRLITSSMQQYKIAIAKAVHRDAPTNLIGKKAGVLSLEGGRRLERHGWKVKPPPKGRRELEDLVTMLEQWARSMTTSSSKATSTTAQMQRAT